MNILEEIRRQPQWSREVMFGLSVISTIAIVSAVWFDSFQKNIYALSNPGQRLEDQPFYAQSRSPYTPSALIENGVSGLRAGIYGLLGIGEDRNTDVAGKDKSVYPMPLSGDRTE